ncbi:MAG: hypothetical protein E7E68_06870 [Staphylococcus sp.]|nr:hypothetical protein [Staphylococcus sp.]
MGVPCGGAAAGRRGMCRAAAVPEYLCSRGCDAGFGDGRSRRCGEQDSCAGAGEG